jgi:tripartite-type tricarboxylate transporter receptor subunit TctC
MLAPARTPQAIVARLHQEVATALKAREVIDTLASMGAEPSGLPPAEFAAYFKAEMHKWAAVIRRGGIQLE